MASQPDKHDLEPIPSTEALSFGSPACSLFAAGLSFDVGYFGNLPLDPRPDVTSEPTPQSVVEASDSGDIPMSTFIDLFGNDGSPSQDQWLVPTDDSLFIERPSTPVDEEIGKAYDKMAHFCDHLEPWHVYDPKTPIHYIISRVKKFAADMATQNATPFLHRYLYQTYMPQCIMSCFATCVLYTARTPANTAMVMRAVHASGRELVDAETGHAVATPVEKLARAQALFLYQIIRLFDGDVALRAQGEKDMPLFQTWLSELCKIRENLGDLAQLGDGTARKQQPPEEWERWIFAESVRRTIVMAYSVIAMYEMMKDQEQEVNPDPWAYVHRWTLARSLWDASSSFEFHRMWTEKPHFVIANYSFENFLKHGRGKDVDDFAEILLSVYMGVDAAREFISARVA